MYRYSISFYIKLCYILLYYIISCHIKIYIECNCIYIYIYIYIYICVYIYIYMRYSHFGSTVDHAFFSTAWSVTACLGTPHHWMETTAPSIEDTAPSTRADPAPLGTEPRTQSQLALSPVHRALDPAPLIGTEPRPSTYWH